MNAGLVTEHAQRNVATARALLPAMMCHIAEALGSIACSSLPVKDQAKVELICIGRTISKEVHELSFTFSEFLFVEAKVVWVFI